MFQMLVTYANNSAVITEAIPDTNRRDNQVDIILYLIPTV